MKNIIFIIIFTISSISYSQNFTVKRVIGGGIYGKAKGNIIVTDSVITTDINKIKTTYKIKSYSDKGDIKTYFAVYDAGVNDLEIRFSLQKTNIYKKAPYQLSVDAKDLFTNQVTQVIYSMKMD